MIIIERKDPRTTNYIQSLMMISGLAKKPMKWWFTSDSWSQIIAELEAQYADSFLDPDAPTSFQGRDAFRIGSITILNAATNDQKVVDMWNDTEAAEMFDASKRRVLGVG